MKGSICVYFWSEKYSKIRSDAPAQVCTSSSAPVHVADTHIRRIGQADASCQLSIDTFRKRPKI